MNAFPVKCRTCGAAILMDQDPVTRRWRPMDGGQDGSAIVSHRCGVGATFPAACDRCGGAIAMHHGEDGWYPVEADAPDVMHECPGESRRAPSRTRAPRRERPRESRQEPLRADLRRVTAPDGFEDDLPW